MTKLRRTKAAAAAPAALSLDAISKSTKSASQTPPTKGKETKFYSADNFPMIQVFIREYLQNHEKIIEFLGEEKMQSFYTLLYKRFFRWLNYRQNSEKMVYVIKREFMSIAEEVLLLEVTKEQQRLTPQGFVIGPLQKMLEKFAADSEPENLGVIPYSQPLCKRQTSTLEDTLRQIREDEMRLSGVEASIGDGIYDESPNFDPSPFFMD
jgi:hypothetical protein